MAEGERPKSSGSHNWNKERSIDAAKRMRAEQAREQAEVIQQLRKQDISRHIADLRRRANTPLYNLDASVTAFEQDKQERANVKHKLRYEQQAGVYSYMKETHHAQTVGDVENILRAPEHKVPAEVVRVWLEGRMLEHDDLLERAIAEGYPELDEDLHHMREQQQWRHAESVDGFLAGLDVDEEDM